MTRKLLIPLLSFATLLASPLASSQTIDTPIAAGSKVTYADLLRLICPDLEVDKDDPSSASATKAIAIRELGSSNEPKPQEDSVLKVTGVSTLAMSVKGTPRVLITFMMPVSEDRAARVLAVFDLGGAAKLADAVGVPQFPDDPGVVSPKR